MAIRYIVQVGDDVLRKKSFPVTDFGEKTHQLLNDMKDTVKKARGAGLAAPQVGVLRRIFVVDVEEGYFEFLNPEIISESGEQYSVEGCLSVVGKQGEVKRPQKVTVKYQDRFGKEHKITARDFFAKAICHENDHLNGVLYIDKADNLRSSED
ncbi:MAG: peptide deformylase [Clostridia bacterium]|nr:peptide deformylase [Clostridia bacterium]